MEKSKNMKEQTAKLRSYFTASILLEANWTGAGGKHKLADDPFVEFIQRKLSFYHILQNGFINYYVIIAETWKLPSDHMALLFTQLKRKNSNADNMRKIRKAKRVEKENRSETENEIRSESENQ